MQLVTSAGTLPLEYKSGRVRVPAQARRTCVEYVVDLSEDSDDLHVLRAGRDVLASPDIWLWDIAPRSEAARITAEFALPNGIRVALPWEPVAPATAAAISKGATVFRVPSTAFVWKTAGAFGRFNLDRLTFNGGELELAFLDGFVTPKPQLLSAIHRAAQATAQFYGEFPVRSALSVVAPRINRKRSFGMAVRGGGIMTVLFYPAHITQAELGNDWTALHELLHLGVPRMPIEDAWFFEGIATYYTEIVRARAGMQSEQRAFQELVSGFARGRRAGTGRSLKSESAQMHETRAYHRVYWAGAAITLLADFELRARGLLPLELGLREFARCCADTEQDYTAERAIALLDAALASDVLHQLASRYLETADFPDIEPVLEKLGVRESANGEVTLDDGATSAQIRKSIVRWLPVNRSATPEVPQVHR